MLDFVGESMATYFKVSREIPSRERSQLITDVAVGDQIDIVDVLGRSAKGLKFITTATTDQVEYKLNNLRRIRQQNKTTADTDISVWTQNNNCPVYTDIGEVIETQDELRISSIEITALTLSSGAVIQIVVW